MRRRAELQASLGRIARATATGWCAGKPMAMGPRTIPWQSTADGAEPAGCKAPTAAAAGVFGHLTPSRGAPSQASVAVGLGCPLGPQRAKAPRSGPVIISKEILHVISRKACIQSFKQHVLNRLRLAGFATRALRTRCIRQLELRGSWQPRRSFVLSLRPS